MDFTLSRMKSTLPRMKLTLPKMGPAAAAVFAIPELVELILVHLTACGPIDLVFSNKSSRYGRTLASALCMRRVSRTWRYIIDHNNSIRKALFLAASNGTDRYVMLRVQNPKSAAKMQAARWAKALTLKHTYEQRPKSPLHGRLISTVVGTTVWVFDVHPSYDWQINPMLTSLMPRFHFVLSSGLLDVASAARTLHSKPPKAGYDLSVWVPRQACDSLARYNRPPGPELQDPDQMKSRPQSSKAKVSQGQVVVQSWENMFITSPPVATPLGVYVERANATPSGSEASEDDGSSNGGFCQRYAAPPGLTSPRSPLALDHDSFMFLGGQNGKPLLMGEIVSGLRQIFYADQSVEAIELRTSSFGTANY